MAPRTLFLLSLLVVLSHTSCAPDPDTDRNATNQGTTTNNSTQGGTTTSTAGTNNASNASNASNTNGTNNAAGNNGSNNSTSNNSTVGTNNSNGSNNTNGTNGERPPVPFDDFHASMWEAICRAAYRCTTANGDPWQTAANSYGNEAACMAATAEVVQSNLLGAARERDAVANGRRTYDPALGAACIAAVEVRSCGDDRRTLTECMQVFGAAVGEGEPCLSNDDCVGRPGMTARCRADADVCYGRCISFDREGCGATCTIDQYCPFDGDACEPRLADGATCLLDGCGVGAVCDDLGGSTAQCTPLGSLVAGAGCGSDAVCSAGLYCDPGTSRCAAKLPAGSGCASAGACEEPAFCTGATFATATCVVPGSTPVGEFCAADMMCTAGAFCAPTSDVCATLSANGADCQTNDHCESGFCDQRVCRPPRTGADGAACSTTLACADGLYCHNNDVCAEPAAAGASCDRDTRCMAGLICVGDTTQNPGLCGPAREVGESCTSAGDCAALLRCFGGMCDTVRTVGESCTTSFDCASWNCSDSVCAAACTTP